VRTSRGRLRLEKRCELPVRNEAVNSLFGVSGKPQPANGQTPTVSATTPARSGYDRCTPIVSVPR
jgi:hypothetical protein